ncbi:T-box transcription factor TBX6 [Liparis tanakae]|uniref:T-box transcription factor TBX6 n=1 Tax=Liparis tanakae TaxID=230148 RepID=A0A4Z2E3Q8_9TELE|nr:T-box transcription factor TBX6 [Liparis tanakae]
MNSKKQRDARLKRKVPISTDILDIVNCDPCDSTEPQPVIDGNDLQALALASLPCGFRGHGASYGDALEHPLDLGQAFIPDLGVSLDDGMRDAAGGEAAGRGMER